ncbi:two-component system OmpR family response regulator [Oceanisphaera litoralis]|uniref:response regulator n=1 Tax=Oceanisphaera litoralis TaxID=225144 RepID=UPI00195756F7|nr:response regulator [Oceanisphaera litoralis]MBM7456529.1 two-component system OmpR family response regulator [Oceanisphaera litoralis]
MNKGRQLLVVDDHGEIRDLLKRFLEQHGYRVQGARDGQEMRQYLSRHSPDLIILDLMLPGDDGLTLCRELRGQGNEVPIIMLTAVGEETDRIVGLEMGADDYLPKPFNPRELLARIKAVLRRRPEPGLTPSADEPRRLRFDHWTLDLARRELLDDKGVTISLSTAEFDLLRVFTQHPHRVLSRDQLLDLARGREAQAFDRAIDTLVSRLRRKLESDSRHPQLIKTIWGGGYMLAADIHHGD